MKRKGFKIEDSELESGWALRKLTILTLQAILKICQMHMAYNQLESPDINEVFDSHECACLKQINVNLQGKTEQLKNKNPTTQLSWATWIIARLGGWSGYTSQRPPGHITLRNGLEKFNLIFQGYQMTIKDVYTR